MTTKEHETVDELVLERLDHSDLPPDARDLVIAALLGDDELAAALGGSAPTRSAPTTSVEIAREPAGAYLTSIEVAGFRGIGPPAALPLPAGPGLTLITGRNGSGKSSFAEAAELVLTGDSKRWSGRSSVVWREGWRNMHTTGSSYIQAGLAIDGKRAATAERHWSPDADLDAATSFLQVTGERRDQLTSLGWESDLELYRPFLSYSELGGVLTGKPSEMYDSLQRILGLDALVALEARLKQARKGLNETSKRVTAELPALRALLADHPDPRAREAEQTLSRRVWELEQLDELVLGKGAADDGGQRTLHRLAALSLPDASDVAAQAARLGDAQQRVADLSATPAAEASHIASLLRDALSGDVRYRNCPNACLHGCLRRLTSAA